MLGSNLEKPGSCWAQHTHAVYVRLNSIKVPIRQNGW